MADLHSGGEQSREQSSLQSSQQFRNERINYAADPFLGNLFENAEVILRYTRADALADGALVDVSETAREAGFAVPVALSAALWSDICAIPQTPEGTDNIDQSVSGRLWDVLFMGWYNIGRHGHEAGDTLAYEMLLPVAGENRQLGTPYTNKYAIKTVIGPDDNGKPCLTFMRPGED